MAKKKITVQGTEAAEYAFPTKSRCPRCRSLETKAVSTQGRWQYRECTIAVCRRKYTVEGKKV